MTAPPLPVPEMTLLIPQGSRTTRIRLASAAECDEVIRQAALAKVGIAAAITTMGPVTAPADVVEAAIYCGSVSPTGHDCELPDGHPGQHEWTTPDGRPATWYDVPVPPSFPATPFPAQEPALAEAEARCGEAWPHDASLLCFREPGHDGMHAVDPGPDRQTRCWPATEAASVSDEVRAGMLAARDDDGDDCGDDPTDSIVGPEPRGEGGMLIGPFAPALAEIATGTPLATDDEPCGDTGPAGLHCTRAKGHNGRHTDGTVSAVVTKNSWLFEVAPEAYAAAPLAVTEVRFSIDPAVAAELGVKPLPVTEDVPGPLCQWHGGHGQSGPPCQACADEQAGAELDAAAPLTGADVLVAAGELRAEMREVDA